MMDPNLRRRYVFMYFALWSLLIFQMFGGLIVLLEYVSKQNMLIVSILMSKQHHFYCNMKAKQISQLTRKCRERQSDIGWKSLSGKLPGDEAKKVLPNPGCIFLNWKKA